MGHKKTFTAAAQPERFDFKNAVSEAYAQNPRLEHSVYFVDIAQNQVAHPNPETLQEILQFISSSDTGKKFIRPQIQECQRNKTSYCHFGGESSFVYIYTGEDRLRFFSPRVSGAQEMTFIFDHEFAHAHIAAGGSDNRFLAENTADVYALIRHIQRFGNGTALADEIIAARAQDTVFRANGILNFSCAALEHVLANPDKIDYAQLTPERTSALAETIAQEYTPDAPLLKRLHGAFAPLHEKASMDALAKISLETKDAAVLKWSATVLKALLAGAVRPPQNMPETNPDKAWNKHMAKISRRMDKMAQHP
ncbi:MAG: hypothetical protein Q8K65_10700 [Alphaproteobacteria bacterium]|nr:hypothetical protein [Alphaproteobacteria bacterium]